MNRIVGDLSHLPVAGMRAHSLWWWAGMSFMLIEGTGFALAAAAYLYLMNGAPQWPLNAPPPDLAYGTAATVLMLVSLWPNAMISRAARRRDLEPTQILAVIMTLLAVSSLVLRGFEFAHLNVRWDWDAYGSIVWGLMALHTVHLVTDALDTGGLTAFLFTHPVDTERFADVDDNASYWAFIVGWQVLYYVLIYWAPRGLA